MTEISPTMRVNKEKNVVQQVNRQLPPLHKAPATISILEAVKCDISYKWMNQFERMHQERVQMAEVMQQERAQAAEKSQSLEANGIKLKEKVISLQSQLDKSNSVIREMKRLLKEQRKVIPVCSKQQAINYRQCKIIEEQRNEIQKLRVINFRSKKM